VAERQPTPSSHGSTRRHVVQLYGELTAESADYLRDTLREACPEAASVELDLSAVTRIDRDGATALLDAYVGTLLRHGTFALSGPSMACLQSLKCFGVLDAIQIVTASRLKRQWRSIQ